MPGTVSADKMSISAPGKLENFKLIGIARVGRRIMPVIISDIKPFHTENPLRVHDDGIVSGNAGKISIGIDSADMYHCFVELIESVGSPCVVFVLVDKKTD
jgi:D-serine dehydratase